MSYHKQFAKYRRCAPGVWRQLFNWMHDCINHDGSHSISFPSRFDRWIYDSYNITDLYFSIEFWLQFSIMYLTYQERAGQYHVHWSSVNEIWSGEHWHVLSDHCICIDELSCLTIWSLKSSKSWHIAKYVQILHFKWIHRDKSQFAYTFLRQSRSR